MLLASDACAEMPAILPPGRHPQCEGVWMVRVRDGEHDDAYMRFHELIGQIELDSSMLHSSAPCYVTEGLQPELNIFPRPTSTQIAPKIVITGSVVGPPWNVVLAMRKRLSNAL